MTTNGTPAPATEPDPGSVLEWLYPERSDRMIALQLLAEGIRVAHAQRETSWALSLKDEFIRLNAGRAEVVALLPDEIHFIVDRTRVPARFGLDAQGPGLKAIPGCATIDLAPAEAVQEIEDIRAGWHSAIRAAAMSARTCPYAKHHSTELLRYLRTQLEPPQTVPEPKQVSRGL